jgi:peptidyl-prolyl cis-trans isomerase C
MLYEKDGMGRLTLIRFFRMQQHGWPVALVLGVVLLFMVGCTSPASRPSATPLPPSPAALPTSSPVPSPTPLPAAARVNDEPVFKIDYEAELGRLQAAQTDLGQTVPAADQQKQALDELIDETLLAQAAVQNGYTADLQVLKTRVDALASQVGGMDALRAWQTKYGYTEDSFNRALQRSLAGAWQRDKILAALPDQVEQVHVLQILLQEKANADAVVSKLKAGAEFATLARKYDPLTGGDLGWFPRGALFQPEVETAAFNLQPGGVSDVIQSKIGYHIIQLVERANRPLDSQMKLELQRKTLQDWLEKRRSESKIEILSSN